jgi:hypothetical protein
VHVAGEFNGWNPDDKRLEKSDLGEWVARVMLRSGRYEYCFVVDGKMVR